MLGSTPYGHEFDYTINRLIENHSRPYVAALNGGYAELAVPIPTPAAATSANSSSLKRRKALDGVGAALNGSYVELTTPTATSPTTPCSSPVKRRKWLGEEREKLLKFVCAKCGMEFGRESYYEQHLDNIHTELQTAAELKMLVLSSSEAECLICGAQVQHYTVRDLQAHHFVHLEHKSFKCKCHSYYFHDKASVLAHLKYQNKHEELPTTVAWEAGCSRILEDGAAYDPDYPETGIGYTCPECGNSFAGEDLWKQHCNEAHDFKSMQGLGMSRQDAASVRCDVCGAIITGKCDNYKLRRHKLTHSPFKAFHCRLCKYSRKRKDDVLLHIRQTHVPRGVKYY